MSNRNYRSYKHLYYSKRWREKRKAFLKENPQCAFCGDVATVADHINPHKGDQFLFFNGKLQALCATCHNSVKKRYEQSGKLPAGCDADGNPEFPPDWW